MLPFIHLRAHSHYSLLRALPKIPDLIKMAKKNGMKSMALTDLGNLYGAIEFYKECEAASIKPIIGVDFYLAPRGRSDKQTDVDNQNFRLVLLSKNFEGYKNLIKLVSVSFLEGFYYKPRIDKELLKKYGDGLIAIIPSFGGDISFALRNQNDAKAKEIIRDYQTLFKKDDLYLEIANDTEINGHKEVINQIKKISTETGVPLVASQEVYYLNKDDKKARNTLLSIQNSDAEKENENGDGNFSFISQSEANEIFKEAPEALLNTKKISDACDLVIPLGKWVFPDLKLPFPSDQALKDIVYGGLKSRNLIETKEIKERVEYELNIINKKGYAPYFLVVSDILRHAREKNILTTTRGSAAGSMVSYLSYITTVNPIEYELPFERFLNIERPSPPDIDMDIADDRRDELIEYAKQKYGYDHVAQIGTFGTMMARGAVRDVARAMGYSYASGDRIAKLIPMGSQGFPMTIDKAIEITPDLKTLYEKDNDTKEIMDMAKKIEGCARHISVHAAGVVISPTPLTDYTPLQYDTKEKGQLITQYDMYAIEDAGLLKFDFLGIRNLAILAESVNQVKKLRGVVIDIDNIPLDDKKTFEMLAKGETVGLFQLNGSGITRH